MQQWWGGGTEGKKYDWGNGWRPPRNIFFSTTMDSLDIQEFQTLCKKHFQMDLTPQEASLKAYALIAFIEIVFNASTSSFSNHVSEWTHH